MTGAIGFDLDMTLVDSAAGIGATLCAAIAEHGVDVPPERVWSLIGLPLEEMIIRLAHGLDAAAVAARYREMYPRVGVPQTLTLPGAHEAVDAVRELAGARVIVVSTKVVSAVQAVLDEVGLVVDEVHGDLFGRAKAGALRESAAFAYVGDHPADVSAARLAGATAVAVATGPHPAAALTEAGADVVLDDLLTFPDWLASHLSTPT